MAVPSLVSMFKFSMEQVNIPLQPDAATDLPQVPVSDAARLVSVVVPFMNERETLEPLSRQIDAAFSVLPVQYEVLFVDDGSSDGGSGIAEDLCRQNHRIRLIRFTRNFGKAAAISAGIANAKGDVIITIDADLQDDPVEIPRFLEAIGAGNDYVCGWKTDRRDSIGKTVPSRIFNLMTSQLFNIRIHDINCGFKAYTRRAALHLNLYGELHRFTPAILHAAGYRGTEIPVTHHARVHGESKYGSKRLVKGLLDMITVKLFTRYNARPLHFFAMFGLPMLTLGGLFITYLTVLWFLDMGPIGNRPLLLIGVLLVVTGTQVLSIGLVAELIQASGMQERRKYVIDRIIGGGNDQP